MIVDDNLDAAQSLGMLCEQFGHEVDFAYDGNSGLEAARRLRPDIVFADLMLPGVDGYELARQLRLESPLRDLMLIAVSGFGSDEDRRRARDAGFDHHLVKPADPAFIQSLLRQSD